MPGSRSWCDYLLVIDGISKIDKMVLGVRPMTTQLDAAQRQVRNADEFRRDFGILHQAAVGVIMVRTREPFRAIETLRGFAFGEEGLEFRCWSIVHGWAVYNREQPMAEPVIDNTVDLLAAMKLVGGLGEGGNRDTGWQGQASVNCVMYPHLLNLSKNPALIHLFKEYSKLFAENRRRLVLVVPVGYELPPELEDDVVIMDFDTPSYAELRECYDRLLTDMVEDRKPSYHDTEVDRVLSAGAGMVMTDFEIAMARALVTHRAALPNVPIDDIVSVVMQVKTEMVKRSAVLELMDAEDMSNVGGLDNLKDWLRKRALCFGQEARDAGVEPPRGIALLGPPGTGKSLIAKATAHMLGLPLVKFDVGRVFQSLVGQSEGRVRATLKMVDAMAPCVLFIDEVDKALQANSGGGDSGGSQRVLGNILTWMQESKAPVFIVVTGNRVANLPAEFLRRGRLDEVFSVQMPSEVERMEVLRIHLTKRGINPDEVEGLDDAVAAGAGYCGAELEGAVKDALIHSFTGGGDVTGALIVEQLQAFKPLSIAFADDFAAMEQWAENNARPANAGEVDVPRVARVRTRAVVGAPPGGRALGLDG